jgi:hypothetical protein
MPTWASASKPSFDVRTTAQCSLGRLAVGSQAAENLRRSLGHLRVHRESRGPLETRCAQTADSDRDDRGLVGRENGFARFSRAAFQRMPATIHEGALWQGTKDLGVIPVHGSGWNAWSTPEQVMNSLSDPLDIDRLLSRIYQRQHGITRAQMRRRFRAEARLREVPERAIHR